jgi:signal transduction histidine kinase/CheY-like chemotaxis protein
MLMNVVFAIKVTSFKLFVYYTNMSLNKNNERDLVALDIISYFSKSIFKDNSSEDIVWDIAEKCIESLGFNDCVIYLKDNPNKIWAQIAAYGSKKINYREIHHPIHIPFGKGIVGSVGDSGVAEVVRDTVIDERYIPDDCVRSSEITVPIWCDNEVIGIIDSEHEEKDFFTSEHLRILQSVANICGQKIGRALSEKRTASYARFYEINPNAVFRIGEDGVVIMANEATYDVFGDSIKIGEIIGVPELSKEFLDSIKGVKEQLLISSGKAHYLLDVCPNRSQAYFNVYTNDVTDLMEEKERVKRAESAKSDFLSTMSHEIRTPLNAIIGLNYLMLNQKLSNEELHKYMLSIEFSGKQLHGLVTDILDLNRLQEGKTLIRRTVFNLHKLCKLVVTSFSQQAQSKSNGLSVKIDKSSPVWVRGDVGKVTQVLNNLINNALKFTKNGHVNLSVSALEKPGIVKFEIQDTGRGISKENIGKIFDAFVQSDDQEVNVGDPGSGLGLAISKQLAELHGGSLSVKSKVKVGSTFTLELALVEDEKPNSMTPSKSSATKVISFDAPVLIVDDNPLNSFVVCEMVKRLGFNAITEIDSMKVLDVVEDANPFLIFMDIQMPNIDGYQVTRMLRGKEQLFGEVKIPIIALTADAEPSTKKKAIMSGMDDLIVKPFAPTHLELIVNRYASLFQSDM